MAQSKRVIFRAKWDKETRLWGLFMTDLNGEAERLWSTTDLKREFVKEARAWARDYHYESGHLAQLVVYNKNGRIAFEATYGSDPRRRKG